jgi:hypothetical protein
MEEYVEKPFAKNKKAKAFLFNSTSIKLYLEEPAGLRYFLLIQLWL